jgi:hypothetical protein
MKRKPLLPSFVCLVFALACQPQAKNDASSHIEAKGLSVPDTCPVTRPSTKPFRPPPPYSDSAPLDSYEFSYGTDQLWVDLPTSGIWKGLQLNWVYSPPVYSQGVVWWRRGYDRHDEPHPDLQIKGRRLDAPAQPLTAGRAEGDRARTVDDELVESPDFMAARIDLPTLGCWEVTGRYKAQTLTFVVWATDK